MSATVTSPPTADPGQAGSAISTRGLGFRYGDRVALRDLDLDVTEGAVVAVLGPNGSGKSTLFRILATLVPPTFGEATILGKNPASEAMAIRAQLGVVFQSPSLDPILTARENLTHQGHLYGLRGRDLTQRANRLLEVVGLLDRAHDRTAEFSGGMRRRLEIAKALLHDPRLVVLDEPSTGLDPGARREVWDYLHTLRRENGMTVVFTTHLMDEAAAADRVLVLDRGVRVAHDTPERLSQRVGGDMLTLSTPDAEGLARDLREQFDYQVAVESSLVRLELEHAHQHVARLVETFPGRITEVSVRKPDLESAFFHLTGRHFDDPGEGDA